MASRTAIKNVFVLGGSYGGGRAARLLAQSLPKTHRVILVDRNSHHNHLYVFPRYAVTSGHEHKAFIPYARLSPSCSPPAERASSAPSALRSRSSSTSHPTPSSPSALSSDPASRILLDAAPSNPPPSAQDRHLILHATVESISASSVTLSRAFEEYGLGREVDYDYMVYALGSRMPQPLEMSEEERGGGTKKAGVQWLKRRQELVREARNVVVVGGGALGIQSASDIAHHHSSSHHVTLVHSRARLLPRFDPQMHDLILRQLRALGVQIILEDRIVLDERTTVDREGRVREGRVRTRGGRELECDLLLLCTGQQPNTSLLSSLSPSSVDPQTGLAKVTRTMQLASLHTTPTSSRASSSSDLQGLEEDMERMEISPSPYPNIFVIGDAADAFGAIKAGHTAWFQAEVAAKNIVRLVRASNRGKGIESVGKDGEDGGEEGEKEGEEREEEPTLYMPGKPAIKVTTSLNTAVVQLGDDITVQESVPEDLDAAAAWTFGGADPSDMHA